MAEPSAVPAVCLQSSNCVSSVLGSSEEPQHGMLGTGETPTVNNTQSEVRGVGGGENLKALLVH